MGAPNPFKGTGDPSTKQESSAKTAYSLEKAMTGIGAGCRLQAETGGEVAGRAGGFGAKDGILWLVTKTEAQADYGRSGLVTETFPE